MIRTKLLKWIPTAAAGLLLALVCLTGIGTETVYAEDTAVTALATNNTGDQNYTVYYSTQPYSYLTETGDGLMRVEYSGGTVYVEYYDSSYNLISQKEIEAELSNFGGFYAGEDAYYLVFGQSNTGEDDSVEVIRVVKYSTDWERQGAAGVYGANTYVPFKSGSCRMTEYGGYLYIRTCHTMYASSDGLHHQANLTIEVQESDMTVTDSYYSIMNVGVGYVSHSFNQFIMVDDEGNLIALDHGDAYPRSAVLCKYKKLAGSSTFTGTVSYINLLTFQGETGTNATGASLGGLEYSSTSYLAAGNSVTQDENWSSHTARNVFVTVTSRSDFSSSGTEVKWITDYDTDGTVTASTPQLVKLGSDSFLLLWTTAEYADSSVTYSKMTKLHYVYLDGEGNTTSDIYTADGQLSDCQPMVSSDGSVVWYVTGDSSSYGSVSTTPVFYSIDTNGNLSVKSNLEAPGNIRVEASSSGLEVSWDAVDGAEGYYVYRATGNSCSTTTVSDGETTSATLSATGGNTYYIWVEAYSGSAKSLAQEKQAVMIPKAAAAADGLEVSWGSMAGADSYQVYRKTDDEEYTLVNTTSDTSWVDTDVTGGETYTYRINVIFSDGSSYDTCDVSAMYLDTPTIIDVSNAKSGVTVTWETVTGATRYYVYFTSDDLSGIYYTYVTAGSGTTQSKTISSYITSGSTCSFYVRAYNSSASQYSAVSETLSVYYLKAPTVTVTDEDGEVTLSWGEVGGADGYYVYRKIGLGEYELVQATSELSWTDPDASDNTLSTYQVFAYNTENDVVSVGSTEVNYGTADISDCEITLSQTEYTYDGSSKKPTVTVVYGTQTLTQYTHYTVSYTNYTRPGTATVTVTGTGYFTGTKTLEYTINKAANTLSASLSENTVTFGDTATITASGVGTITYSSDDTSVATVSSSGVVTAVGAGTAVITVSASGSSYYEADSTTFTITVTARNLSDSTVTLAQSTYTYDGTVKKPAVTVSCNSVTLTQGTDYTVTYGDSKNVGTYTVTVTGKGNYTGTNSAQYTITKADLVMSVSLSATTVSLGNTLTVTATASGAQITAVSSDDSVAAVTETGDGLFTVTGVSVGTATITVTASPEAGNSNNYRATSQTYEVTVVEKEKELISLDGCTVTLSSTSYTYDGTAKKPTVTVKDGSATLTSGTDYTVAYSNNTNAGTATVTVTGKGDYTGTATKNFTINKASQTVTASISSSSIYVGKTAQITASTTGAGTLSYSSSSTSVATVSSSGVVTGVAAGTATITVTAAATTNYKSATKTVSVTVVKNTVAISTCTITLSSTSYTYDGMAKKPTVTVKDGSTTLTSGTDYTVAYSNNTNAGTATVTVTGKGDYTGTATKTFTINKASQTVTASISATSILVGGTAQVTASTTGTGTLSYASGTESVAKVSSSGLVTGVSAGSATITVTAAATTNYKKGTATVTVKVLFATPVLSGASNTATGVKVTWGAVDGAAKYRVFRKTSGSSWKTVADTASTSYTDTTAVSGTTYYYTVRCIDSAGSTYTSSYDSTGVKVTYIAAPTLSAVSNTTSGVKVTWGAVTGAVKYRVFRKTGSGSWTKLADTTSLSYTDTTAKSGTTYKYTVRCINSAGTSYTSSYNSTGLSIKYLTAGKISSLTNTSTGITVKWSKVTGASGYYVYRKTSGGSYSKIKTVTSGSTVSYTDTAVKSKNGTTYVYAVRPYYSSTLGSYTGKTTVRLTGASLSSVSNSASKKMTVKWSKASGVTGYQIQYSTSSTFASGNTTVTVSGASTVSKVISGLTKGKTYYVRIRTYKTVSNTKYYSAWSSKKSVKISK